MPDGPAESPYGQPLRQPPEREPYKILPVLFILSTIVTLYLIYTFAHLVPMLQLTEASNMVDIDMRFRGLVEFCIFNFITLMLITSYVRCILVHPGEVPSEAPWLYTTSAATAFSGFKDTKKNGERRHCKWCGKYKPDRCHHCRVCNMCILKMDHHCPWIYNCVGFANYKFFFLLLLYSVLDTHLIVWTMAESVRRCVEEPSTPFATMFLTFFTETLAFFLMVLVTMFFGFHIWLMSKAMTTIEFCEKSMPKNESDGSRSYDTSVYDLGLCGNVRAVLGSNILLWFFPCSRPTGDGLNFMSDETRLTKDLESGKGIRRRTHQRTQRTLRQGPADGQAFGGTYSSMGYGDMLRR
mmetsp:Transcript_114060/g.223721  ORF Transcript_114060/g.223721 Transcript_114060/m.223721 type:complete len:353 (-) Transcript_114060:229-1287(-)